MEQHSYTFFCADPDAPTKELFLSLLCGRVETVVEDVDVLCPVEMAVSLAYWATSEDGGPAICQSRRGQRGAAPATIPGGH